MWENNNPDKFVVGPLIAEPGQSAEGHLKVGTMPDGTPLRLPIVIVNGTQGGKTLYLQSISDGDELNGIAVVHEILRQVRPNGLRGRLIAAPIVNVQAFHAKQAHSPVDNMKMNRCFPGRPDGTSSERIAYRLFHTVIRHANYCIDLHQGGVHPMIDEVRVRVDGKHPQYTACLELARIFGIGYIFDQKGPKGQLAEAAPEISIPTIDPELGGCHGWDADSIAKGVRGVLNVLKYYGFIDGEPELPRQQTVVNRFVTLLSNHGGFVYYKANLYDRVEPYQPIAEICDVFGHPRETIRAPESGIFWSRPVYPMVASGEVIGKIGIPTESIH
ncbi:MAG: succinylglutamate desuccinylase/aspartoacylase family protein [Candidatus Poribacteria bacterium]|nr:succinylglutamate desuccinylase/aspartoacylase family protein [Candidatus Poribacteria bacterium]